VERLKRHISQGLSVEALIGYSLHLADNALILGHRNSEWTGHGPILEQDIAISNIALDLVGQARNFYQYAAKLINNSKEEPGELQGETRFSEVSEDSLAYFRDVREFKNCLLVEQDNGDWAHTILRQFFFSAYQSLLYAELQQVRDKNLAAISEKALKEVTYHLRWSSEWVIRLGDGTVESQRRMLKAIDGLWKFTGELFTPSNNELTGVAEGWAIDPRTLKTSWMKNVNVVFEEAGISNSIPPEGQQSWVGLSGKDGNHSEHLGYILADMQFLQRAYPGCDW
jgi:ring-1,2-phenylacetyl-CoA epoxidase subunit PaaC